MIETTGGRPDLVDTGVSGLDDILRGGLAANRLYLIGGDPGSGKTTVALQFLLAGVRRGERCMFVALSETEEELQATAESHGWSLEGIDVVALSATEATLTADSRYTMFHPSEVELAETVKAVFAEAERLKPARLVFDSLSELRLLAENPLRFRRQVLAIKQYFARQRCTVLLITDRSNQDFDTELQSIAHGVINIERRSSDYGAMRRRMQVVKMRGRDFRGGYHDVLIRTGGVEMFPRLVSAEHRNGRTREAILSGLDPLDTLLGEGLARGTSTLILGPAGTGKSSLATHYAIAAARRGERSLLFLFDESVTTFVERSAGLGMDVAALIADGSLRLQEVDPAELSPGVFAHGVRRAVEEEGVRLVVIDSLNGYLHAMPNERFLTLHLHELLGYLGGKGVTTLMLMAQHGLIGTTMQVPVDASYLADTVLLLRYFEAAGEVRQAISVIKKRTGRHERMIRELRLVDGIAVGEPLRDFQGVLNGTPEFVGRFAHDAGKGHDAEP